MCPAKPLISGTPLSGADVESRSALGSGNARKRKPTFKKILESSLLRNFANTFPRPEKNTDKPGLVPLKLERNSLRPLMPRIAIASSSLKSNGAWGDWLDKSQARQEILESPQLSTMEQNTLSKVTLNISPCRSMKQKSKHLLTLPSSKNLSDQFMAMKAHLQQSSMYSTQRHL